MAGNNSAGWRICLFAPCIVKEVGNHNGSRVEKAVMNRQSGYNCSQAVPVRFVKNWELVRNRCTKCWEGLVLGWVAWKGYAVQGIRSISVKIENIKEIRNMQIIDGVKNY